MTSFDVPSKNSNPRWKNLSFLFRIVNQTIECGYPIGSYGNILITYLSDNNGIIPEMIANRLIIRDGQTLMSEGIPFTTANSCQPFSFPYGGFQLQTQFCCIEFQEGPTVTPGSSSSTAEATGSSSTSEATPIPTTTTTTSGAGFSVSLKNVFFSLVLLFSLWLF